MKNNLLTVIFLIYGSLLFAQQGNVGINTPTPSSTLEIKAKSTTANTSVLNADNALKVWNGTGVGTTVPSYNPGLVQINETPATATDGKPATLSVYNNSTSLLTGYPYIIRAKDAIAAPNLFVVVRSSTTNKGAVGINVDSPTADLDVSGTLRARGLATSSDSNDAILVTDVDGNIKKKTVEATRFSGGTVYVRFASTSGGTLANASVIGGAPNMPYTLGTLSQNSSKGGINQIVGTGYKISNPQQGIFDIQFDAPFSQIYGISVNIVDAYGNPASIPNGTSENLTQPGMKLATNDNSQVSYLSNTIIRVKTGDSSGTLANRPFTFMITGK